MAMHTITVGLNKETHLEYSSQELDSYNLEFHDISESPISIHGLIHDEIDGYIRIPKKVAQETSESLLGLYRMDAGGRVKFASNSNTISIRVVFNDSHWVPVKMSESGSCSFDLYEKNQLGSYDHIATFFPEQRNSYGFVCLVELAKTDKERDLLINFPIFAGVREMQIGIEKGSSLSKASEYKHSKPVVFYGSSITHGAFASRPGNAYPALLSQKYDFDYYNFGFSGACRAEEPMMEYLSKIDMSIFVLDYDYNARTEKYLKATHYKAYETIRKSHKDIPIIMASRPNYDSPEYDGNKRRNIIYASFKKAKQNGDENVYFVDGKKHFKNFAKDGYTVDYSHPNDGGFRVMANAFSKEFDKIYK